MIKNISRLKKEKSAGLRDSLPWEGEGQCDYVKGLTGCTRGAKGLEIKDLFVVSS